MSLAKRRTNQDFVISTNNRKKIGGISIIHTKGEQHPSTFCDDPSCTLGGGDLPAMAGQHSQTFGIGVVCIYLKLKLCHSCQVTFQQWNVWCVQPNAMHPKFNGDINLTNLQRHWHWNGTLSLMWRFQPLHFAATAAAKSVESGTSISERPSICLRSWTKSLRGACKHGQLRQPIGLIYPSNEGSAVEKDGEKN